MRPVSAQRTRRPKSEENFPSPFLWGLSGKQSGKWDRNTRTELPHHWGRGEKRKGVRMISITCSAPFLTPLPYPPNPRTSLPDCLYLFSPHLTVSCWCDCREVCVICACDGVWVCKQVSCSSEGNLPLRKCTCLYLWCHREWHYWCVEDRSRQRGCVRRASLRIHCRGRMSVRVRETKRKRKKN